MRNLLILTFLLAALLIAFVLGSLVAIYARWGEPIVEIVVKNESDQTVESITINYTTCGLTRKIVYQHADQNPPQTDQAEILTELVFCGEGSHQTKVVLSDGRTFSTVGDSYLQNDTTVTERVTNTGIVSEYKNIFW